MKTEESVRRMREGRLYLPGDEAILRAQAKCLEALYAYNATQPSETARREALLREMFCEIGARCFVEPPFYANFGGRHVHFGNDVYANFGLTMVDDGHIYVGDNVMFGPHVTVATAGHPIDPELRRAQLQYNIDVHIGANVWIGAGAVILPGVTIGSDTVIGAGSIVTKDIPSGVVAVGNPCRVLRPVGERDRKFYFRDRPVDLELSDIR